MIENTEDILAVRVYRKIIGTVNKTATRIDNINWIYICVVVVTGEISYKIKLKRSQRARSTVLCGKEPKQSGVRIQQFTITRFLRRIHTEKSIKLESELLVEEADLNQIGTFDRLIKHWIKSNQQPLIIFNDLKGLLKVKELWYIAYAKLYKNTKNKTPEIILKSLGQVSINEINKIRDQVLIKKFTWNLINQLDKSKNRQFNSSLLKEVPISRNLLVQEALRILLQPIYEAQWLSSNHGFRLKHSRCTALYALSTQFKNCSWFIKGDIINSFSSANYKILIRLIKRRVTDKYIIDLIKTGLQAKIIKFTALDEETIRPKMSQDATLLSSLLLNVYFHELDLFVEQLKLKCEKKLIFKDIKSECSSTNILNSETQDIVVNRICYIRYENIFLVGVVGNRKAACLVHQELSKFLQGNLKLNLNPETINILHISEKISFLGYLYSRRYVFIHKKYDKKPNTLRRLFSYTLTVDFKKLKSQLKKKGFCDGKGKPLPCFRYLRFSQIENNKKINSVLHDLNDWWSIAKNRRTALCYTSYIIRYSLAKMYAAKFKLGTVAQVFKISGNDLSKPLSVRKKSIVGVTNNHVQTLSNWISIIPKKLKIENILYGRYYKTPKLTMNFDKIKVIIRYRKILKENDFKKITNYIVNDESHHRPPLSRL